MSNKIDLSGRNAVITGGAQGIGRAIVERFLDSGAAVAIWRLKRSVVPSYIHPPSLQREAVSIDFPSRTRSAFAVASRSAR